MGISEEPQESQIQHTGTAEQAGQTSDGSGQRSQTESGRPDHTASGERPGTGEISRQHALFCFCVCRSAVNEIDG